VVSDAIDAYQPDNPSLFVNCTYSNAVASIATFTVTVEGVYDLPALIQVDGKVSIPIELSIPAEDMLQGDIYIPDLKELAQSFAAPFENIFGLFLGPLGSWISSLIDSAIAQIKRRQVLSKHPSPWGGLQSPMRFRPQA
jgi:hypothetical protein